MTIMAFGQGITFFHGTYEELLQKARTEKKQIFVDVYTSWCGPCKMMAKDIFTRKDVGDFFNQKFVCMQLDAEKEKSHGFFQQYQAGGFPSFFWLDEQGKLLDTKVGAASAQEFINNAGAALSSDLNKRLEAGRARWEKGERSPELVRTYVLGTLDKVHSGEVDACMMDYFSGLSEKELLLEENYEFLKLFMNDAEDNLVFRNLMQNADVYKTYEKGDGFWVGMYRMVVRAGIMKRENPPEYEEYKEFLKRVGGKYGDMYLEILDNEYAMFQGEFNKAIRQALAIADKYQPEHSYLYGEFFYTLIIAEYFRKAPVVDTEIEQVIQLAETALKKQPCKRHLLYLAAAYARKSDDKKAYELLANEPFFPTPILSNALYPYLNLPVIHREYLK